MVTSDSLLGDSGGDRQSPAVDLMSGDVIGAVHDVPPGDFSIAGIVTAAIRP